MNERRLWFKFSKPFPTQFTDREEFEEFILDQDMNNVFGRLKTRIAREESLDIDDESEEQAANELTWREIYKSLLMPYESHY